MKKEIIANCTPDETRIALLEDGRVAEIFIERQESAKLVGNIYKGKVENVLPGISSAFVNIGYEKNAYLYITDVLSLKGSRGGHVPAAERKIEEILTRGQEIVVQVAKEVIGTKGMKISMDISLPGRFLVFMPFQDHIGVSKHIEDKKERDRLRRAVEQYFQSAKNGSASGGFIIRTEAEGTQEKDLEREVKYLLRLWDSIQRRYKSTNSPGLVHRDLGLTFQMVRDILSEDVEVFLIDSKSEYQDVLEFVEMISPSLKDRIRYYDGRTPIFEAFHVEEALEQMRRQRITLPSGGSIVIQEAESLCAIDVNTGKYTGNRSQEETVTLNNLEAAAEVAQQLRLRNIGGIIVIDFIDMRRPKNRHKVVEALTNAVRHDRAKIKILPITRLGLVEMTRERKRESTITLLSDDCPECGGSGKVLSRNSLFIKIKKEILNLTLGRVGGELRLLLHPTVAEYFRERKERLEKSIHRSLEIQADNTLAWEDYRIIIQ